MRASLKSWLPYLAVVALLTFVVCGLVAMFTIWPINGGPAPLHPTQQIPGHISDNDLRNGITAVTVTVNGRRVPCVYAAAPGSSGGWAGGVSITCDWSRR